MKRFITLLIAITLSACSGGGSGGADESLGTGVNPDKDPMHYDDPFKQDAVWRAFDTTVDTVPMCPLAQDELLVNFETETRIECLWHCMPGYTEVTTPAGNVFTDRDFFFVEIQFTNKGGNGFEVDFTSVSGLTADQAELFCDERLY